MFVDHILHSNLRAERRRSRRANGANGGIHINTIQQDALKKLADEVAQKRGGNKGKGRKSVMVSRTGTMRQMLTDT